MRATRTSLCARPGWDRPKRQPISGSGMMSSSVPHLLVEKPHRGVRACRYRALQSPLIFFTGSPGDSTIANGSPSEYSTLVPSKLRRPSVPEPYVPSGFWPSANSRRSPGSGRAFAMRFGLTECPSGRGLVPLRSPHWNAGWPPRSRPDQNSCSAPTAPATPSSFELG